MKTKQKKSRTAAARGKAAILVEVTLEEKENIQKAAESTGLKPAQFLRNHGLTAAKKINGK